MTNWIFRLYDALKGPKIFEILWHLLARVSPLTAKEISAASSVLGPDAIQYSSVRVTEGRFLRLVFRFNRNRGFTTFHTINLPSSGRHSRIHVDLLVHELVHVYQFERVGSQYIWQALRAQRREGYKYGGWEQLMKDQKNGKHFKDYNREQQGQIAQDYYREVVEKDLPETDLVRQAFKPFIDDLRKGDL